MPPLTCGTESFNNATTVDPRILLVVDRSKSMDNAATGFAGSKWEATQSTMSNVVSSLSNECEFGLMLYPNDETSLCGPATFPVAVSASGAAQVVSTLNATSAFGATPTASALRAAKTALDGMSGTGGTRAVILTTDGAPNCNSGANANTCTSNMMIVTRSSRS